MIKSLIRADLKLFVANPRGRLKYKGQEQPRYDLRIEIYTTTPKHNFHQPQYRYHC